MNNTLEHEGRALNAVRLLTKAAEAGSDLTEPMSAFIKATSALPAEKFGVWERRVRNEVYLASWSPSRMRILTHGHKFVVPWLDLFNGDGFRRERLLRTMNEGAPNAFLFAILIRRLNDWVPQVRAAARDAVPGVAAATHPEIIVATLREALPNLPTWGRWQTSDLDTLAQILADPAVASVIARLLIVTPSGPGAALLAQAGRKSSIDQFLPTIAAEAVRPAVRAKAYKSLLDNEISWLEGRKWTWTDKAYCEGRFEPILGRRKLSISIDFLPVLRNALDDKSAVVRRMAGDLLIRHRSEIGSEALVLAKKLLKDTSPSLAERGDFILKNATPV